MGQTSPRQEKAPSRPQAQPGMWYLSSWRDLPRRSNAGHGLLNKPEITPPSHSNHRRDGTGSALHLVSTDDLMDPNAWTIGPVINGKNYSVGMPLRLRILRGGASTSR